MFLINRRALAVIGATAAAIGTTGFLATPAQAATGGARVSGTNVYFSAAAGQTNNLTITISGRTTTFDDVVAITPGAGCKAVGKDKTKVQCTTSKATTGFNAQLGDKNDTLTNRTGLYLYGVGGTGDDRLYGGSGRDVLYGQDGNDIVSSGSGDDIVSMSNGNDTVSGGNGNDIIYGGTGIDRIAGGAGHDDVYAEAGDDFVWGDAGVDLLYGQDGNDTLSGGADADWIYGGKGNEKIYGGAGSYIDEYGDLQGDTLVGEAGDDLVYAEDGNDLVVGGAGNDSLMGQNGDDELQGGDGNDKIWGHTGLDEIWGEGGNDILAGSENDDFLAGEDVDAAGLPVGNPASTDWTDGGAHNAGDYCAVMLAANATSTCEWIVTAEAGSLKSARGKSEFQAPTRADVAARHADALDARS